MSTEFEHKLPEGTVLGDRYRVGPLLGEPGGQGAVYRAWDDQAAEYVAVKVIHPGLYRLHREQFDAEISLLSALDSAHVIELLDVFDVANAGSGATRALVMPQARRTMASLEPEQRAEATVALLQAAKGLEEVHGAGWTHNDVKPANVLDVGGRWVLADFGIATPLEGTHAYSQWADGAFAAPERRRGEVRTAGDIWSFGMTSHLVLVGGLPAVGSELQLDRRVPPAWGDLIGRCLQTDPSRRPSASDLVSSIERMQSSGIARPGKAGRRRRRLAALGAVVLAGALGAVIAAAALGAFDPGSEADQTTGTSMAGEAGSTPTTGVADSTSSTTTDSDLPDASSSTEASLDLPPGTGATPSPSISSEDDRNLGVAAYNLSSRRAVFVPCRCDPAEAPCASSGHGPASVGITVDVASPGDVGRVDLRWDPGYGLKELELEETSPGRYVGTLGVFKDDYGYYQNTFDSPGLYRFDIRVTSRGGFGAPVTKSFAPDDLTVSVEDCE